MTKYTVTLGEEKALWLKCETLDQARDVAAFASANHGTIAQVWIDCRNGARRLYESVRPTTKS